jgi:MoxR-like ATPase
VQAALLEAMEERQVTVAGKTHKLPELFLVLATQNPVEQEGTYPLPEAQMDRFIMKVYIDYPGEKVEHEIMKLVRGEDRQGGRQEEVKVPQQAVFGARQEILGLHVAEGIETYIVSLVVATRDPGRYGEDLKKWIDVGSSPRATLSLDRCARAHAWLKGNDHVTPDDVRAVVHDVLRHRLILSYEANAEGVTPDDVITAIVKNVAVA